MRVHIKVDRFDGVSFFILSTPFQSFRETFSKFIFSIFLFLLIFLFLFVKALSWVEHFQDDRFDLTTV